MNHPAVAVLHQVARLAVYAAGGEAVGAEEVWVHGRGLAVPPRRGQVGQLGDGEKNTLDHQWRVIIYEWLQGF